MKIKTTLLIPAFLTAFALPAHADMYIGGGLYNIAIDEEIESIEFDSDDTSVAFFLGWRPIELLGAEVGYYDFGEQSGDGGYIIDGGATTLAALLSLELGPVGLYGKGGIATSDFDIEHPILGNDSDSSSDAFGAVGLTFDILDKLYIYGEVAHFDNEAQLNLYGAGLRYQF